MAINKFSGVAIIPSTYHIPLSEARRTAATPSRSDFNCVASIYEPSPVSESITMYLIPVQSPIVASLSGMVTNFSYYNISFAVFFLYLFKFKCLLLSKSHMLFCNLYPKYISFPLLFEYVMYT